MASTGSCDSSLFGGPFVVVDTEAGQGTGGCDVALFGGPAVIAGAGGGGDPEPPATVPGLFFANG